MAWACTGIELLNIDLWHESHIHLARHSSVCQKIYIVYWTEITNILPIFKFPINGPYLCSNCISCCFVISLIILHAPVERIEESNTLSVQLLNISLILSLFSTCEFSFLFTLENFVFSLTGSWRLLDDPVN